MTYKELLDNCYELYKKDWCAQRGIKLEDVDEEVGVNSGECFVSLYEFNDYEFRDEAYMKSLLDSDSFNAWLTVAKREHLLIRKDLAELFLKRGDLDEVSVKSWNDELKFCNNELQKLFSSISHKFIFDDELCFGQDEAHETVDGYLWAMDGLMDRMMDAVKSEHSPDTLETFDNINFYPIYNLRSGTVKIEGTYYFNDGNGEKQGEFELPLSDEERVDLIKAMEVYCQKRYGKSCLEELNSLRVEDGLEPLVTKTPLSVAIKEAETCCKKQETKEKSQQTIKFTTGVDLMSLEEKYRAFSNLEDIAVFSSQELNTNFVGCVIYALEQHNNVDYDVNYIVKFVLQHLNHYVDFCKDTDDFVALLEIGELIYDIVGVYGDKLEPELREVCVGLVNDFETLDVYKDKNIPQPLNSQINDAANQLNDKVDENIKPNEMDISF